MFNAFLTYLSTGNKFKKNYKNSSKMTTVEVRNAKKEDMKHVFALIQELAEFENMGDRVKINTEILERDGFDLPSPIFFCKVAETSDSLIVGYALYYDTYSTWLGKSINLEDIYVKSEYRAHGIGKKLFLAVAKEAFEYGTRLDFSVLSWNPAMDFYKKFGAENLTELEKWNAVRLDLNALKNLFENN